jgi:hypothetical protein
MEEGRREKREERRAKREMGRGRYYEQEERQTLHSLPLPTQQILR